MKHLIIITLFIVTLTIAGCGRRGLQGLAQVSGTITLNGQPLDGATILLFPQADTRSASAISDAGGNFRIATLNTNDGVQPGNYLISVSKIHLEGDMPYAEKLRLIGEDREKEIPKAIQMESVPEKYTKPETSGLMVTVKSGRNEKLVLALEGEAMGKRN
ncbi:MAG: carboxypeptidase-like regulatory domain-containing protein [Planctomycetaceae bacterium]|jgi:hypothetical protein|nr:carboxypeptidase-like regulatory domain-containing protein [Planctomycetaceae bacterium]